MCWDSLRKRRKQLWDVLSALGESCWGLERGGTESLIHWKPEPGCIEDSGSNVKWCQIVISAGFLILSKVENWMKHLSTYCLQTDSELRILRDIETASIPLLSSGGLSRQELSEVWFGLVWDGKKTHAGGETKRRDLLLGSGEMRRGLKSCSSLTLMKLIFTHFLKINEIICVVIFSHQSR